MYYWYEKDPSEELPKASEYNVILNSKNEVLCITKITKVYITKFNKVTKEHAYKEGDLSLSYWRKVHKDFTKELALDNLDFTSDMDVVCEEFSLIFKA